MTKPAILAVDDELEVLNAVERALRKHFATDYRMLKAMWNRGRGAPCSGSVSPLRPLPAPGLPSHRLPRRQTLTPRIPASG